jgi:chemotaxis protein MotB
MAKRDSKKGITVIKKEEVVEGGHHGGAWKVAYADFVTAMMAFFLLMWLLNATTEAQRRGLADYFAPTTTTSRGASGIGKPFGGSSPYEDGPAISDRGTIQVMNANAAPVDLEDDDSDVPASHAVHSTGADTKNDPSGSGSLDQKPETAGPNKAAEQARAAAARATEQAVFAKATADMQKAIASDPALAPVARQFSIDLTPEGLRIQIRDEEQQPMFATGSADLNPRAQELLKLLAPVLIKLPEPISIAGYTDAAPYSGSGRTNWDLSAERANATLRILSDSGLLDGRVRDVTGHADRDLLHPETPLAASNRRIAITLLRTAPPPDPVAPEAAPALSAASPGP